MTDSYDKAKSELESLRVEQEEALKNNIITNTVLRLLEVEKNALYGSFKNKNKAQETIINEGLGKYKERENADS